MTSNSPEDDCLHVLADALKWLPSNPEHRQHYLLQAQSIVDSFLHQTQFDEDGSLHSMINDISPTQLGAAAAHISSTSTDIVGSPVRRVGPNGMGVVEEHHSDGQSPQMAATTRPSTGGISELGAQKKAAYVVNKKQSDAFFKRCLEWQAERQQISSIRRREKEVQEQALCTFVPQVQPPRRIAIPPTSRLHSTITTLISSPGMAPLDQSGPMTAPTTTTISQSSKKLNRSDVLNQSDMVLDNSTSRNERLYLQAVQNGKLKEAARTHYQEWRIQSECPFRPETNKQFEGSDKVKPKYNEAPSPKDLKPELPQQECTFRPQTNVVAPRWTVAQRYLNCPFHERLYPEIRKSNVNSDHDHLQSHYYAPIQTDLNRSHSPRRSASQPSRTPSRGVHAGAGGGGGRKKSPHKISKLRPKVQAKPSSETMFKEPLKTKKGILSQNEHPIEIEEDGLPAPISPSSQNNINLEDFENDVEEEGEAARKLFQGVGSRPRQPNFADGDTGGPAVDVDPKQYYRNMSIQAAKQIRDIERMIQEASQSIAPHLASHDQLDDDDEREGNAQEEEGPCHEAVEEEGMYDDHVEDDQFFKMQLRDHHERVIRAVTLVPPKRPSQVTKRANGRIFNGSRQQSANLRRQKIVPMPELLKNVGFVEANYVTSDDENGTPPPFDPIRTSQPSTQMHKVHRHPRRACVSEDEGQTRGSRSRRGPEGNMMTSSSESESDTTPSKDRKRRPVRPTMDVITPMGDVIDFSQFLRRLRSDESRRKQTSARARRMLTPSFQPSLCNKSLVLVAKNPTLESNRQKQGSPRVSSDGEVHSGPEPEISVLNSADGNGAVSQILGDFYTRQKLFREKVLKKRFQSRKANFKRECPFKPKIDGESRKMSEKNLRTLEDWSRTDGLKYARNLSELRKKDEQMLQKQLTFSPKTIPYFTEGSSAKSKEVQGSLRIHDDMKAYIQRLKNKENLMNQKRTQRMNERIKSETKECTFKPATKAAPNFIKRIAQSMVIVKEAHQHQQASPLVSSSSVRTSPTPTTSFMQWY